MITAQVIFSLNKDSRITSNKVIKFKSILNKEFHELGGLLFEEAQIIVPYDTGNLQQSATIRFLPDGFRISYDTPYAYPLHEGESIDEGMTGRQHVSKIRRHKRRLASGKVVNVRKHTKTYQTGYKPMLVKMAGKDTWTVIDVTKEYQAQPWLRWAWENVIRRLPKKRDPEKVTVPFTAEVLLDHLEIDRVDHSMAAVTREYI